MYRTDPLFFATAVLIASTVAASADVRVAASIKPVHSLVAAVMEGIGEPGLIVDGAGSPHNFALKPSQAQMLESADVVFWIGQEMETFLAKPLETIAANARSVELIDSRGLTKLQFREGGAFDDHADDAAGHDDPERETEAGHNHGDDSDDDHANDAHDGDRHHEMAELAADDSGHGEFDGHVWLDPVNAKAMVQEINQALAEADPANAERYAANASEVLTRLDALVSEVTSDLAPVREKGFIVFHDAYRYFERRFGVTASGSITVSPDKLPGAERIAEIRDRVEQLGATCVFAEPQFEPKLVTTVTEGTGAMPGVIDPLGAELEAGPGHYFETIRAMAASIQTCLTKAG